MQHSVCAVVKTFNSRSGLQLRNEVAPNEMLSPAISLTSREVESGLAHGRCCVRMLTREFGSVLLGCWMSKLASNAGVLH